MKVTFQIRNPRPGHPRWANWRVKYTRYDVIVTAKDRAVFPFWAPKHLDVSIAEAADAIIGDALAGFLPIQEFVAEFGYDDGDEAEHVHNACKRIRHELCKALGLEGEQCLDALYVLSDALRDMEEEAHEKGMTRITLVNEEVNS